MAKGRRLSHFPGHLCRSFPPAALDANSSSQFLSCVCCKKGRNRGPRRISKQVCSRRMPPWNAVKGFGEFQNDPSLSQEEIEIIAAWVANGAPEGDPAFLPPQPDFQPQASKTNPRGRRLVVSGTKVMKHA